MILFHARNHEKIVLKWLFYLYQKTQNCKRGNKPSNYE